MRDLGENLGESIRDAASIQAQAFVFTEFMREKHEERTQYRQHRHEESLMDRRIAHEREMQRQERLLRLFELAFQALDRETQLKMLEGAFRVVECERKSAALLQDARNAAKGDPALRRLEGEIAALKEATGTIEASEVGNEQISSLDRERDVLDAALKRFDKQDRIVEKATSTALLAISVLLLNYAFGAPVFGWLKTAFSFLRTVDNSLFWEVVAWGFCVFNLAVAVFLAVLLWHLFDEYVADFILAFLYYPVVQLFRRYRHKQTRLQALREEIGRLKSEAIWAERSRRTENLCAAENRRNIFEADLLQAGESEAARQQKQIELWAEEVLSKLPPHAHKLCYHLAELYR